MLDLEPIATTLRTNYILERSIVNGLIEFQELRQRFIPLDHSAAA